MKNDFSSLVKKACGLNKRMIIPECNSDDLKTIARAARLGIIHPVFLSEEPIHFNGMKKDFEFEFIKISSENEALQLAIEMAKSNKADIIMQGRMKVGKFLSSVLDPKTGLNTLRRASHACMFYFPGRNTPVIITDTFLHDHPSLHDKQVIIENSVALWMAIGMSRPKISALAILEYVNPKIHSTLDSAVLSKMAERHQFGDVYIEGPLDIDCAISRTAADRKGVRSIVAGDTDIYLVHDVESGYLFAEHLVFIGGLACCSLVLGTSKPVIIDLPFVCDEGRLASIAIASLCSSAV
jgi:phosphotransacetylase